MTISEAVQKAKKCLEENHVPDYSADALSLLQFVCGIDRARYYACGGEALPDADRYLDAVRIRASRVPLQQIMGETYFFGLRFVVTEDVLCPRIETELLVEEALKRLSPGNRFKRRFPSPFRTQPFTAYQTDLCSGAAICLTQSAEPMI